MTFDECFDEGMKAADAGQLEAAQGYFLAALNTGDGTDKKQATCLANLGNVYQKRGQLTEAATAYQEALTRYQGIPDTKQDQAVCLANLGNVYLERKLLAEAATAYREALTKYQTLSGPPQVPAEHLSIIGNVHRQRGFLMEAVTAYREALAQYQAVSGPERAQALSATIMGNVYLKSGRLEEAETTYQEALTRLHNIPGTQLAQADCLNNLGVVYQDRGLLAKAETTYQEALTRYQEIQGTERKQAGCLLNLGSVYQRRGLLDEARTTYQDALTRYQEIQGAERQQADCHMHLGNLHRTRGLLIEADAAFQEAGKLVTGMGLVHDLRKLDLQLALLREKQSDASSDPVLLREALTLAVRSFLDADSRRFQFRTERDRLAWAEHAVGYRATIAFRLAARVGDAALIADLIAVSRGAGILDLAQPEGTSATDDTLSARAADLMLFDAAMTPDADDESDGSLQAGGAVVAGLGLDEMFRRRPLPGLRMPNGRLALEGYEVHRDTVIRYR